MSKKKYTFLCLAVVAAALISLAPSTMAKGGKNGGTQVIYTGDIAKKVIGYNGTTPVKITISNGKISKIEALSNKETPAYFNKAKDKVFKQFIGKTVDEGIKLKADIATGATYSSEALIKNIKMGLKESKGQSSSNKSGKRMSR